MSKVTLILGNGFDLDLGLKTSYKSFYESDFCPKDYPAPLIQFLNSQWPGDKTNVRWYDLENALYDYKEIKDKKDLLTDEQREYVKSKSDYDLTNIIRFGSGNDQIFNDLIQLDIIKTTPGPLRNATVPYRDDIQLTAKERDRKAFYLIKEGIGNYLKTLQREPTSQGVGYMLLHALREYSKAGNIVNIYSFNYTPLPYPFRDAFNDSFFHVHGEITNSTQIIGTRDYSIIDKEYGFLQKTHDVNYAPPALYGDLLEADKIIIFGHSLGENDDPYFSDFFIRQSSPNMKKKSISIYTKDEASQEDINNSLQRITHSALMPLRTKNDIKILKTDTLCNSRQEFVKILGEFIDDKYKIDRLLDNFHKAV